MNNQGNNEDSTWVTTFVFIAGLIVGAGTALLMAPEAGTTLRERLAKGAKTAQDELADIATDTKQAVSALSQEAQKTMKETASRVSAAVEATKEAVKATPHEHSLE